MESNTSSVSRFQVGLESELWAKTALKKLPEGLLDWDDLFGAAPARF